MIGRHRILGVLVAGVAAVLLAVSPCHGETLTVGYFELPPHAMTGPDGEVSGAAVAYFRQIASRMGVEQVRFDPYPLARLQMVLETGELDVGLLLAKNDARQQRFVYPAQPFYVTQPIVAVLHSSPLEKLNSADDLVGLAIGAWQLGYFPPTLRDPRLSLKPMAGENVSMRNLLMLQNGRIDAFFSPDSASLRYYLEQEQMIGAVRLLPLADDGIGLYTVFSKAAAERHLKAYEAALQSVQAQKSYQP